MSPMPANSMHGLFQQSSNFRGALSAENRTELNSRGQIETLLASPVNPYDGNQEDVS
jgi:hypothetical protein